MDTEVCCCYVTMVIKVTPRLETTPFASGLWGLASCRVESCPVGMQLEQTTKCVMRG